MVYLILLRKGLKEIKQDVEAVDADGEIISGEDSGETDDLDTEASVQPEEPIAPEPEYAPWSSRKKTDSTAPKERTEEMEGTMSESDDVTEDAFSECLEEKESAGMENASQQGFYELVLCTIKTSRKNSLLINKTTVFESLPVVLPAPQTGSRPVWYFSLPLSFSPDYNTFFLYCFSAEANDNPVP